MAENQLSEDIEYYDDHQNNHVLFDPINENMENFCTLVFHFHLHYEDHIHYKLICSSHYHGYFEFECNQEIQVSDQINDWLHWKFHVP